MLTVLSLLSASMFLIKGFRLWNLTKKKNEVPTLLGLEKVETTGLRYFLTTSGILIVPSIVFDVISGGNILSMWGLGGGILLALTSLMTHMYHDLEKSHDVEMDFKKVQPTEETLETFFGEIEMNGRMSFGHLFGFSPFTETRLYFMSPLKVKSGKERDDLIRVAKVYHEAKALDKLRASLPNDSKLNETDRQKKKELEKMIETKVNFLKKSSEIVKAAVVRDNEAYYSDGEKESVEALRNLKLDVSLPRQLIHPTVEELVHIQSNPNVSQHLKEEARELEHTIENMLKNKTKSWTEDELARFGIETVKRFHHIN